MKRVYLFRSFTVERLGRGPLCDGEIIDTCLQAMQEGVLDVCAQNTDDRYLWTYYGMMPGQWQRACGLLQQAGIPSNILWDPKWFIYYEPMAEIEYLWTDLERVERFLMECCDNKIYQFARIHILQELDRRRAWNAGLRRGWLAACTI
jgi:hypothetical protein